MKKCVILAMLFLLTLSVFCLEPPQGASTFDDNGDGKADRWEFLNENGGLTIYMDTKGTGNIDYVLEQNKDGYKVMEALDFNGDGELDDFYYYTKEVLIRREIDTNYDGNIDTWVYISEGVYIEKYERDTDFDGVVDLVKTFGEPGLNES